MLEVSVRKMKVLTVKMETVTDCYRWIECDMLCVFVCAINSKIHFLIRHFISGMSSLIRINTVSLSRHFSFVDCSYIRVLLHSGTYSNFK